jgi:hypothetical protein
VVGLFLRSVRSLESNWKAQSPTGKIGNATVARWRATFWRAKIAKSRSGQQLCFSHGSNPMQQMQQVNFETQDRDKNPIRVHWRPSAVSTRFCHLGRRDAGD